MPSSSSSSSCPSSSSSLLSAELSTIHRALDTGNFAKVLRLTANLSNSADNETEVLLALRAYALQCSGRRGEALAALCRLFARNKSDKKVVGVWKELAAALELQGGVDTGVWPSSVGGDGRAFLGDVRRLEEDFYSDLDLDQVDNMQMPVITEETVLETVAITLHLEGLFGTLSEMYHQAMLGDASNAAAKREETKKAHHSIANEQCKKRSESSLSSWSLEQEAMDAHLGAICDCSNYYQKPNTFLTATVYSNHHHLDLTSMDSFSSDTLPTTSSDATTTSSSLPTSTSTLPCSLLLQLLQTQLRVTQYHERLQMTCLRLCKSSVLSVEDLYFQWAAMASLWYREALEGLSHILSECWERRRNPEREREPSSHSINQNSESIELLWGEEKEDQAWGNWQRHRLLQLLEIQHMREIPSLCQTITRKLQLLPRLAESFSLRVIRNRTTVADTEDSSKEKKTCRKLQHAPSETDWDVYLETLKAQGKYEEALNVLSGIHCSEIIAGDESRKQQTLSPLSTVEDVDKSHIPRPITIHDEDTISNYVGTILPFTQRKKLEQTAIIACELGKFDTAEICYKELLRLFPDQWTYWLGLVNSCVKPNRSSSVSSTDEEEGWKKCQSFIQEIISAHNGEKGKKCNRLDKPNLLRGPHLLQVELAALKIRYQEERSSVQQGEQFFSKDSNHLEQLRKALCDYGDKFGPVASCSFADLRKYVKVLVQHDASSSEEPSISREVYLLLQWAKGLWMIHSQSNNGECVTDEAKSKLQLHERRKQLRMYIFAVQIIYEVATTLRKLKMKAGATDAAASSLTLELLQEYAPSISQLVREWRASLTFLPSVSPKDGGQKETLPGDETVLLACQYIQFQASCESSTLSREHLLITAAALLEETIENSPYNPHLKIAAIGIYSQLQASFRALVHYENLGVKQIQHESCSYLILPLLLRGGLYNQAIQHSSTILRLHGSTSKDVKEYASKSFHNGYVFKAKEMINFQTERMRPSIQLLQAKGYIMDCAALMIVSDVGCDPKKKAPVSLGAIKGLCGSEEDVARAEKIVIDAQGYFNAPSLILSSNVTYVDSSHFSDNRDKTVNCFEILHHHKHLTKMEVVVESLMRGHMQGLLVRAVFAVKSAKAPRKGKIPKATDEMSYRCNSLLGALERAKAFMKTNSVAMNDLDRYLWDASCALCEVIVNIIHGSSLATLNESLVEREKYAVSVVELATSLVSQARGAVLASDFAGDMICKLLPDRLVPLFTLVQTTGRLFNLFGWGKRKRMTKAAAGALATLALLFRDFLTDMLQRLAQYRRFDQGLVLAKEAVVDVKLESLQNIVQHVEFSRNLTKDRVDPFLSDMRDALNCYDERDQEITPLTQI